MTTPAPGLGHNLPPLLDRAAELVANVNRWRKERPAITSEEQAKIADDNITLLRAMRDELKAAQDEHCAPLEQALFIIKLGYKDPRALVKLALESMLALQTTWLEKKRDRLAAEAAERKRLADQAITTAVEAEALARRPGATVEQQLAATRLHEAADQATKAALTAPRRPRVKGDYSPRAMSLHSRWKARVIDEPAALRHFAKHPEIRAAALEAITAVASKMAKDCKGEGPPPPGTEFYNEEHAV